MRSFTARWKQTAADLFGLPPDALLQVPRFSCLNGNEMVVENVVALHSVTERCLQADLGFAVLSINGSDFVVTLLTSREIHLRGRIDSIQLDREGVDPDEPLASRFVVVRLPACATARPERRAGGRAVGAERHRII